MELQMLLGPLAGYAIGTMQSLLLDGVNRRAAHRRELTCLRAELRRLAALGDRFGWGPEGPISDTIPKPPRPLPVYVDLVARMDFRLTDEHDDDNSQEALFQLVDGCETLQHYWDLVMKYWEELRLYEDPSRRRGARDRGRDAATQYDATLERVQLQLETGILDLTRRIEAAGFWWQVRRAVRGLPKGESPPPLRSSDDPRLRARRDAEADRLPPASGAG